MQELKNAKPVKNSACYLSSLLSLPFMSSFPLPDTWPDNKLLHINCRGLKYSFLLSYYGDKSTSFKKLMIGIMMWKNIHFGQYLSNFKTGLESYQICPIYSSPYLTINVISNYIFSEKSLYNCLAIDVVQTIHKLDFSELFSKSAMINTSFTETGQYFQVAAIII